MGTSWNSPANYKKRNHTFAVSLFITSLLNTCKFENWQGELRVFNLKLVSVQIEEILVKLRLYRFIFSIDIETGVLLLSSLLGS